MKSTTDIHWNERAATVKSDIDVNTMDVYQRNLEFDYICKYLGPSMNVLEVGCGNGISTKQFRSFVKHVDSFDYSENMIARAKSTVGETNNRFFVDNVLAPQHPTKDYDVVICVRVLINLQNLEQQLLAIQNLQTYIRPNGLFILVEGYIEGFRALSSLRAKVNLPAIEPAKINRYSSINDILPKLKSYFKLEDEFHLGMYDFLTRVHYPLVVGIENIKHNTVFSEKSEILAREINTDAFKEFSRIRGFVLRKISV